MSRMPIRTRSQVFRSSGTLGEGSGNKFLAVGIDFGTTYSGVTWACSETPDELHEILEWPAEYHNHKKEPQVPTQIDLQSGKWGYEVTRDMNPIKWFKLLLLKPEDIEREEIRNSPQLQNARSLLRGPNSPTATQVVGRYLEKLWRHTYAQLSSRMSVDSWPLRVAITVPAIWPPYAHAAMKEAAKLAGITEERDIGTTTLDLVQEPEAAGRSILFERAGQPEIKEGESFIVCDAGGGTVDVISYKVDSLEPFHVREPTKGDGNLSGAFRIDEAFEIHLRMKTKLKISSLEQGEFNAFVAQDWEMGAKRTFTGGPDPPRFILRPPAKAFKTLARIKGKSDFSLSKEEMKGFFSQSLTGIRTLISDQIKQVTNETGVRPKKIFLVGGLGSSPYIYDMLHSQFQGIVLRPLHPWSAVARGAVLRLLLDKISTQTSFTARQKAVLPRLPDVTARKSRYNYGILVEKLTRSLTDFEEGIDTVRVDPEGDRVTPRMDWYLFKGDEVSKKSPVLFHYSQYEKAPLPRKCVFYIQYSSANTAPKRKDSTVNELCRVECDWDKPFEEWTPVGVSSEGWRRHDDLELAMRFEGEAKWKMRVGSRRAERDVNVEYMG